MKDIFNIYKSDIKRIFKNKVTLITILVLCIIPSLYAFINIKACWDPYSNTGNLPIAVVNRDKGAKIKDKELNIGAEIEKNLKGNSSINWIITDEIDGAYGLDEGKYYALIEIPDDFTEKFLTVASGNPKKPEIIYKSNEKANAIATKITAVAKDSLKKEITENFVETLNKTGIEEVLNINGEMGVNDGIVYKINNALNDANKNIKSAIALVENGNKTANRFKEYMEKVQKDVPLINDGISKMEGIVNSNKEIITSTHATIINVIANLREGIVQWQVINNKINKLFETSINKPENLDVNAINNNIAKEKKLNQEMLNSFNMIKNSLGNNNVDGIIQKLKENQALINSQQEILKGNITIDKIKELIQIGNKINENLVSISKDFYEFTLKDLNSKDEAIVAETEKLNQILESSRNILPKINSLSSLGINVSDMIKDDNKKILEKLIIYRDKLNEIEEKTNSMNGNGLNELINTIGNDPEGFGKFMASPIDVKQEEIYKGGVFGVGITPFYSVLAIWVGALLTASLLSTHYKGNKKNFNLYKIHFGKMGLFLTISIIQGLIISLGSVYLLGVPVESMGGLILISLLCSLTFTIIIFTLASVFGNVGKAVAVIIMVFQIAGAGGLYPVQTTPWLFQIINPYLPFTYGINGFREAIGGIEINSFGKDIAVLLIMSLVALSLVILKPHLHKLIHWFEEKFEEAEI
ncbi:MAG: YhgE/Pip family protein [Clostridium sp.]